MRDGILEGCAWLGVARKRVGAQTPDLAVSACLSEAGSKVSAWVIATDENAVIARHSLALLSHEGVTERRT
ncbi:hypothetical protein QNM99_03155 [Pseudomonas sp. PCH446]